MEVGMTNSERMGGEAEEEMVTMTMISKLGLVLAAKSKALGYTSPASPNMFASPIHTLASIPFCWEQEPGKPKHHHHHLPHSHTTKSLELPPRLLMPREFTKMPLPPSGDHRLAAATVRKRVWVFWKKTGKGDAGRGSYVFPSCERSEDGGGINTHVKITGIHRDTSLYSLSTPRSPIWVNMYKGFKQVVQRKSKKLGREAFSNVITKQNQTP